MLWFAVVTDFSQVYANRASYAASMESGHKHVFGTFPMQKLKYPRAFTTLLSPKCTPILDFQFHFITLFVCIRKMCVAAATHDAANAAIPPRCTNPAYTERRIEAIVVVHHDARVTAMQRHFST
jgi:hypothetical protein